MVHNFKNWARVRPIDLTPGDAVAVKIVAVVGDGGTWAAYMGLSDWDDERVAQEGDKILEEAAQLLFPQFVRAELRYRH